MRGEEIIPRACLSGIYRLIFPMVRNLFAVSSVFFNLTANCFLTESLWQHFADAGEITSVRVIRDPVTQMGKGFAYVAFAEKSAASLALDLDGSELRKRKIRVTKSVGKPKSVKKREKGKKNAVQTPAQRRIAGKRDAQKAKKPGKFEGVHAKPGDAKGMLKQKGSGKPKIKKQTKKVARGKKSAGTKA